jgi:hypothetical protein
MLRTGRKGRYVDINACSAGLEKNVPIEIVYRFYSRLRVVAIARVKSRARSIRKTMHMRLAIRHWPCSRVFSILPCGTLWLARRALALALK